MKGRERGKASVRIVRWVWEGSQGRKKIVRVRWSAIGDDDG